MKLSHSLLVLPVASLLVAMVVGAGACSASAGSGVNPHPYPTGVTFANGVVLGDSCSGAVFVDATGDYTGWAFCDNGTWTYTTVDPTADGGDWTPYTGGDGGVDAIMPPDGGAPDADATPDADITPDSGETPDAAGTPDSGGDTDAST
jgi:hypothetical protein